MSKRRVVEKKIVNPPRRQRPVSPTSKVIEVIRANIRSEETFEEEPK